MNTKTLVIVLTALFCFTHSATAADDLDPFVVNTIINRACDYLKSKQDNSGAWDERSSTGIGKTSLCTLALLNSGCDARDPSVAKALAYLRTISPSDIPGRDLVYIVSLQTMVLSIAEPAKDMTLIRRNVDWLEKKQIKVDDRQKPSRSGGWGYGDDTERAYADVSCSQFAILALYEAERAGVKCKPETWNLARGYWERMQIQSGAWGYTDQTQAMGSRTSAGLASLIIVSGKNDQGAAFVKGEDIYCCQDLDAVSETRLRRGFNWLEKNFRVDTNPGGGGQYLYYYLYGVERVGRMTGQRFIGQHDWYREGTKFLIRGKEGQSVVWRGGGVEDELVSTSFALLFLSRGRRPILMSKIQYGEGNSENWNAHPQDVNHLTQFVEKRWKMDLTWQTMNWETASAEDLLQSPVLYICGDKNPLPRDRDRAEKVVLKLREYLENGGFIFAEAYGDDNGFDGGFREMMSRVLPEEGYELQLLEHDHPVWDAEIPVKPDQTRSLEGINYGCRTSVIYSSPSLKRTKLASFDEDMDVFHLVAQKPFSVSRFKPSLSCLWEIAQLVDRGDTYPLAVKEQIDTALAIGCNILAYATQRELKTKLERESEVHIAKIDQVQTRGVISVGLLEHGGGSNCAPRAIPRLMETAVQKFGAPVSVKVDKLRLSDPELAKYSVICMHGRNAFRFTEEERVILRRYLDRGGFLFVNSICASVSFTKSFEEEIAKMFPDEPFAAIPLDDMLYGNSYGGYVIDKVAIKMPERVPGQRISTVKRTVEPELKGIRLEGRFCVVFSPYDISCALEKVNSLECRGYYPEDALKLGINILLYSLEHI